MELEILEGSLASTSWHEGFTDYFKRQYTIGTSPVVPSWAGWAHHKIGAWHIEHCPHLPVRELRSATGSLQAIMLGIAVNAEGALIDDGDVIPCRDFDALERWLHGLAGRHVLIAVSGGRTRLYGDATFDMAAVYDADTRRVASSPFLALTRRFVGDPLTNWRERLKDARNYCFGRTAEAGIARMIGNHRLDLDTFEQSRHWPTDMGPLESPPDDAGLDERIVGIASRLSAVMRALVHGHNCALPLSGGGDSRVLLASAAPFVDRIQHLNTNVYNKMSGIDALLARQLGEVVGCRTRRVDWRDKRVAALLSSTRERRTKWRTARTTGYQTFGPGMRVQVVSDAAVAPTVTLRGNIMEIMRGTMFGSDRLRGNAERSFLLRRLRVERSENTAAFPHWFPLFDAWNSSMPDWLRKHRRDLAFTEHLLPNTLGGGILLLHNRSFYVNPFCDRTMISASMSVPYSVRRTGLLHRRIIELQAPALGEVPYTNEVSKDLTWHAKVDAMASAA